MSYEVLARRWRPQTFDEVAGQSHVTVTLRNAIRSERLPHAILLAGPRGVGKTSIARILARSLNCDEGPTEKPCGRCSACTEIANGNSLDVQEIDAASYTGVDNVREVRDSIRYTAAPGKYRIFIIDEVHMLSQAAFNALLKTLEEPPPRSLFVFATTNPQKIPATVLSRVQRFDLKRLGSSVMLDRLREIASAESIEIEESVLRGIVRLSDGSVRDALTLLDRLLSGLGSPITEDDARTVLDLVERAVLLEILDPVLARDPAGALAAVRSGLDKGIEPTRLVADLLQEIRNLVIARIVNDPADLLDLTVEEVCELQQRARSHEPEMLQSLFRVLLNRCQELGSAPHTGHALEMAVVRLATLPDAESISSLIARLDAQSGGPDDSGDDGRGGGRTTVGSRTRAKAAGAPARRTDPPTARRNSSRDTEEQVQLRNEAKADPIVQQAIEILDAELRDIRTAEPPRDSEE